jgi:hypothetical protein
MASASADKWRYTFYTTLVLLILFNPWTYNLVDSLFYKFIGHTAKQGGCPTFLGFLVHAIIFTLVVRYLMDLHL